MGGLINFILGANDDDSPTSEAKNGCHGNAGCLATGQLNLKFVASYFNKENVYKLPNMHIYSSRPPGDVTQFWAK